MKKIHLISAVAAPLIGLTLLTGCSSNSALSDDAACKELRSSLESVGAKMDVDFDPTKDLVKLKEAAPKIQDISDRTESDFKNDLATVANGFKIVGEYLDDNGQLDMAKLLLDTDAQKTITGMEPAFTNVSKVCGDNLK